MKSLQQFWLKVFKRQGDLGVLVPKPHHAHRDSREDVAAIFELEKQGEIEAAEQHPNHVLLKLCPSTSTKP